MDYFKKYLDYANKTNHFMIHNGISLTKFEKDLAEAELVIEKNSLNFLGTMHGGLYLTMADCVAGSAARGGSSASSAASAQPPSSGSSGRQLNADSSRLAPAAVGQCAAANASAAAMPAAGPASATAQSAR